MAPPRRFFEECINPLRKVPYQHFVNILRPLVVYGVVIAEVFDTLSNLLAPAGKANRATSLDLRNLPNGGADTASRRRNRNSLSRLLPANVQQADICG